MPNIDGPYTRENADLRAQVAVLEVMLKRLQYSNSCACPICGEKQNDWGAHRLDCQLDRILSSTPSETRKLEAELDAEVKESIRLNIRLALADRLAEHGRYLADGLRVALKMLGRNEEEIDPITRGWTNALRAYREGTVAPDGLPSRP